MVIVIQRENNVINDLHPYPDNKINTESVEDNLIYPTIGIVCKIVNLK